MHIHIPVAISAGTEQWPFTARAPCLEMGPNKPKAKARGANKRAGTGSLPAPKAAKVTNTELTI
eukprot:8590193-Heterocapsa_arctica.AAC.1